MEAVSTAEPVPDAGAVAALRSKLQARQKFVLKGAYGLANAVLRVAVA